MAEAVLDHHAAGARSPGDIPPAGWFQILKRTYQESAKDNVSIVAAGVAFYAFLAFVPMLAALVLTYGLIADPGSVMGHVRGLFSVMPADAARLIGDQLINISQTATSKKGFGLLLAILLSLYGAMRGATSIITALNIVYGVKEDRGFIKTTMLAALITVGAVVAMITGMIAISVLGYIERLLPFSSPPVHTLLKVLFWVAAAAAISLVIALVYRYAPNRPKAKWAWLTPGSIVATLLWIAATLGFGFYVASFGNYNATYGSLGAVVVFLTWLYLSGYIVLMGGELNSEIEKVADPVSHPNPAS
jgi:membrane protein